MSQVSRVTTGYDERHRAAPTAEQHSALAHNVGHVVRTECPMLWKLWREFLTKTKNLVRNCLSAKANKINQEKNFAPPFWFETLLL
ncbi:hypothetical protein C1H46_002951 [Malus baccata]|uniref:Uncharacterized protein n=1 Tax=Malus baccata TaxID=106549 RepID=A0A540NK23_MALBA|nr:hypothetical protein C1H46_002951 [Malus baccata]